MEIQGEKRKLGQDGFTLVELLIVIVIIGILATITFIALQGLGLKSRKAAAVSSVKSAMSVATTCLSMGGKVQDPAPTETETSDPIRVCEDIAQFAESFWPELPDKCAYCPLDKENKKIYFRCDEEACDESTNSVCDYQNGQCEQKN